MNRLKGAMNIEEKFVKLFSKMWGGSGKQKLPKLLNYLLIASNLAPIECIIKRSSGFAANIMYESVLF